MIKSFAALCACCAFLTGGAALCDPKPQGATPTPGQTIANFYVGKTQL